MFFDGSRREFLDKRPRKNNDPVYIQKIQYYQKITILLIVLIFVSIISYSFGVERGKRMITKLKQPAPAEYKSSSGQITSEHTSNEGQAQKSVLKEAPPAKGEEKGNIKTKDSKDPQNANYTVQVASIKKTKNVGTFLSKLKSKGYSAFSLPKGKYTVICIGKFNLKEDARNYIEKLRANYPDCQIRRL